MPVTTSFNYTGDAESRYTTRVSCRDCGAGYTFTHAHRTPPMDEAVHAFIRFHNGTGRYYGRCRECERVHVRAWREARRATVEELEVVGAQAVSPLADRRFGVELEVLIPSHVGSSAVSDSLRDIHHGFSVKRDGSLRSEPGFAAVEVTTPPIGGDDGFEILRRAVEVLTAAGAKVNRSCGLHVHHEVADLSIDDIKRLAIGWSHNQGMIDKLVAPSRRAGRNTYCKRLSPSDRARIQRLTTLDELRRGGVIASRYKTLNLNAYVRFGTVEIRQHQGTVDFAKIKNWILLGQAMVESARVAPLPKSRTLASFLTSLGSRLETSTYEYLERRAAYFERREAVTA